MFSTKVYTEDASNWPKCSEDQKKKGEKNGGNTLDCIFKKTNNISNQNYKKLM